MQCHLSLVFLSMLLFGTVWAVSVATAAIPLTPRHAVALKFDTVLGEEYQIYRSSNRFPPEWNAFGVVIHGNGEAHTVYEDATGQSGAIYKVERVDVPVSFEAIEPDLVLISAGEFLMGVIQMRKAAIATKDHKSSELSNEISIWEGLRYHRLCGSRSWDLIPANTSVNRGLLRTLLGFKP